VFSAGSHKTGRRPALLALPQDGVNWIFRAFVPGIGMFLHLKCLCASYASTPASYMEFKSVVAIKP
jgi:hypothetical protein